MNSAREPAWTRQCEAADQGRRHRAEGQPYYRGSAIVEQYPDFRIFGGEEAVKPQRHRGGEAANEGRDPVGGIGFAYDQNDVRDEDHGEQATDRTDDRADQLDRLRSVPPSPLAVQETVGCRFDPGALCIRVRI